MRHPVIHIKISKPLPESIHAALKDKKDRRLLYEAGNIKAIREMDKKKDVSISSKR